jgi:AAA family ATP:ADP antiporter
MKGGRLSQLLNVAPGEWKLVLPLFALFVINTLVLELSDVVATAGFISHIGVSGILWLWVIDMLITLVVTGACASVIDRMSRVKLMVWLLGGLTVLYLILQLLFHAGAPSWLIYPALYIMADLQLSVFPLIFWTLANDVYSVSDGKRLFPIIGAGSALGSILGNGLAAGAAVLIARTGGSELNLLIVAAAILLCGILLLWFAFRHQTVRARQARETHTGVRETIRVGTDFFKNVPFFKYLAVVMLLAGMALTIVEYNFLSATEQSLTSGLQFQAFYGTYKLALMVSVFLCQGLLTGRLLRKVPLKNTFIVLPATLVIVAGCVLVIPGLLGAALGRFLARLVQRTWDDLARKSVQGMIPDERRGRISIVMDSYFYTIATLVGCLMIGSLLLASSWGWLSSGWVTTIYLVIAALAAIGAVWASLRLRAVYDRSLLNWRLARAHRKSVLDGVEF